MSSHLRPRRRAAALLVTALTSALAGVLAACPASTPKPDRPATVRKGSVTLTVVGTNDLHGAVDRLPILAGYVANLRAARAADGGEVLLVDAGDMFQGTLGVQPGRGRARW
jgi:2',3'-cyclic-nucleotide 2'-phosphodiesterase (5'-nucleotidase family)